MTDTNLLALTDEQADSLRRLLRDFEQGRLNTTSVRPASTRPVIETYVVQTTATIPAAAGAVPGVGPCILVNLTDGVLTAGPLTDTVYNVFSEAVPFGAYSLASREPVSGALFLVTPFVAGPETACAATSTCVQFQQDSYVDSDNCLHKVLKYLVWTPHGFQVCDTCPSGSGSGPSGSGTGPSGSGSGHAPSGSIPIPCCPGVLLPTTLYLTVTNSTCACLNGTFTLTANQTDIPGLWVWEYSNIFDVPCGHFSRGWAFYCYTGFVQPRFRLDLVCEDGESDHSNDVLDWTCSPFQVSQTGADTADNDCCPADSTFDWVVTE